MCGVAGIVAQNPVAGELHTALTVLQHRGQDAAGIATCASRHIALRKDNGLVRDVFRGQDIRTLPGNFGIGHVRYPTAGLPTRQLAQPFLLERCDLAMAHNGNLINTAQLRQHLQSTEFHNFATDSDSEVLLRIFARQLQQSKKSPLDPQQLFTAVHEMHQLCRGAYAGIFLVGGQGLLGFRDPHGIRPMVLGQRATKGRTDYMLASESVALDMLGFQLVRDLAPGEALFIDQSGQLYSRPYPAGDLNPCLFEYVYLARPDSILDNISVYKARLRMGEFLARKILQQRGPDHGIDTVIPIPDTSRISGQMVAQVLGVNFREGLIKNRYIGRTFIMAQGEKRSTVRQKLNPIPLEFRGKNVLLVDDSIVRGTTSRAIITMAREAGARRVYFASAAPPVRYQNVYGIDLPTTDELIAHDRSEEEIGQLIGADWLVFQDIEALMDAVREENAAIRHFDCSLFDGQYVTGPLDPQYLQELRAHRPLHERCAPQQDLPFRYPA